MSRIEINATCMSIIEEDGKKRWIIHGKSGGQDCKVIVNIGDVQAALIKLNDAIEQPCA